MLNTFTFNGISSDQLGIKVEKMPALNRSARKFRSASVAGHNGNIYEMEDAWEEVVQSYRIYAGNSTAGSAIETFTAIMEWLHSANGYAILTDTYDPTHYREAIFIDSMDIESEWHTLGRTTINFRCRPEHYIVTNPIAVTSGDSVMNPTAHNAFPKITLTGAGASNLLTMQTRTQLTGVEDLIPLPANSLDKYVVGIMQRNPYIVADRATFVSADDSTGTLTFKANANNYGIGFPLKAEPLTYYTVTSGTNITVTAFFYDQNGTYWASRSGEGTFTFRTPSDCGYMVIAFTAPESSSNYVLNSVMLNKGEIAQPFREYTGNASSSITIGDTTLTLNTDFSEAIIDCDKENVTVDGANGNPNSTLTDQFGNLSASYLQFVTGANTITFDGDITAVSVEPRFWTL